MSRVLLIEDEPWLGELYVQLLEGEHSVTWLRDGYEAMDHIDQQRPDIIVLDILLPWASGIQLLHELAGYDDTARIPVILFSAALPDNLSEEVLQSYGVVATLDKTAVKPRQVLKTINGALRAHADL